MQHRFGSHNTSIQKDGGRYKFCRPLHG
jgi:hypothetical protein